MTVVNFHRIVELVSLETGNKWEQGTEQNIQLAEELSWLSRRILSTKLSTHAVIVTEYICDRMGLNVTDRGKERLLEIVFDQIYKGQN